MILLCGIPSEEPINIVTHELDKLKYPYIFFNQRKFSTTSLAYRVSANGILGKLQIKNQIYPLEDIDGIYSRLMDHRFLPELKGEPQFSYKQRYCHKLHEMLYRWLEITPSKVINRRSSMASNFSKPYQMQIIHKVGFLIPDTIITTNPDMVRKFLKKKKKIIYKSISSIRSIVELFKDEDLERLDRIRWCPTQFQEHIEGMDVRVHVIDNKLFATAIHSNVTDYRYAHQKGSKAQIKTLNLSDELSKLCFKLTKELKLSFAGIDLKITPDNRVYCFEVNTSPAFNYYEINTGQQIAQSIAKFLNGIS